MKIVYMGTPDFAVKPLYALTEAGYTVGMVFTQPDRERNRGKKVIPSPVKEAAESLGIKVIQPVRLKGDEESLTALREYDPDIIIVAAYGQILPAEILNLPRYGCVNIHGSILPRFRGASPVQHAILAGDEETGVTIMQMAEGLDTGDMLTKASVPVNKKTASELTDELSRVGAELIVKTLPLIEEGKLAPEKQDDKLASYAGMIRKEDGKLDFTGETAEEAERKVRAFDPWPGTYFDMDGVRLKVWAAEAIRSDQVCDPGKILGVGPEGIDIGFCRGVLRVKVIQAPGKKKMGVDAFLRGNRIEIGRILQ